MRERVEVVAPASTANLGPGFDSIGMALNLFTTVRVELAEETRLFFTVTRWPVCRLAMIIYCCR